MNLEQLLKFVTEKGASDLHLKPMRPPMLRIQRAYEEIPSEASAAFAIGVVDELGRDGVE